MTQYQIIANGFIMFYYYRAQAVCWHAIEKIHGKRR